MKRNGTWPGLRAARQRGVSLLYALCALAALTLGAVALLRSVDTGMLVMGNLGFKRDAVAAGSSGAERAIAWLRDSGAAILEADAPAQGYYAQAYAALDPTGSSVATAAANLVLVDWEGNSCDVPGRAGRPVVCLSPAAEITVNASNRVRYVITRLCELPGPDTDPATNCVRALSASATQSSQRGGLRYQGGGRFDKEAVGTTYRILTRTVGVRGTVAYTETLVHF